MSWTEDDKACRPKPPPWSCWCLDEDWTDDNQERRGIFAVEGCKNCDGYGFMPIPPSEVFK